MQQHKNYSHPFIYLVGVGGEVESPLSGPTDWIQSNIRTYIDLFIIVEDHIQINHYYTHVNI